MYDRGGVRLNGHSLVCRERSSAVSDSNNAWVKPVPTPPANFSEPSGCATPTSNAPNVLDRDPVPALKPPIVTSTRVRFFTLRQFGVRLPGW